MEDSLYLVHLLLTTPKCKDRSGGQEGVHPNPLGEILQCIYGVDFLYLCTYIKFESPKQHAKG